MRTYQQFLTSAFLFSFISIFSLLFCGLALAKEAAPRVESFYPSEGLVRHLTQVKVQFSEEMQAFGTEEGPDPFDI